ncbi:unnamed protein product [Bursaphelenchus okinawaensis]|uniref:glucuronosyltransferase n=1 Tax=Bursaphelenchus okinawaensis TaxID=465554 RepID=A0A811L6S1_9BILA|nr:unnamed protein product [Bursaphelenchus okinawaensis]CAG9117655.1 unnamed protein product [Bursaphelenchus okinawaensis]
MIQNGRVADTLAKGGHNVTLLELDVAIKPGSLHTVKHANFWPETFEWPERVSGEMIIPNALHFTAFELITGLPGFLDIFGGSCLAILKSPHIMNKIRDSNFDVIMFEQFDVCPFVISHLLNIDVKIWMSSCPIMEHQADLVGVPTAFSYVPVADSSECGDQMTFFERFRNVLFGHALSHAYFSYWHGLHLKLKDMYGPDFPSPLDLAKSTDLVLINTDELVDFPRPLPPNVIHVGGLGMNHVNTTLSPHYQSLMESGKDGVVYFSFGTMVSTVELGQTYMKNLLDTFSKFENYFFIVKATEKDRFTFEYGKGIKNVHVDHWIQQPGVLAHPNLRFFITHGGYNGIMEASRFSVPLLLIGVFGDQTRNARLVERNGWGVSMHKLSLLYETDEFEAKIKEMLRNPKYKQNAIRTTKLLQTKPQTGEQRLLSYIKFLEENGGHLPELRSIANQLSVIELTNIDIWTIILLTIVVVIVLLLYVIGTVLKKLFRLIGFRKKEKMQ